MAKVYLISLARPLSPIALVDAEVKQGKQTWAVYRERRHLLGSSAFYTLAAAARAKAGVLIKSTANSFLQHQHSYLYHGTEQQVREYRQRGAAAFRLHDRTT